MNELLACIHQFATHLGSATVLRTTDTDRADLTEISWGELWSRVEQASAYLRRQNVRCLGILAVNSPEWIIIDLAAQHAGVPLIPLPDFFTHQQLSHVCTQAGIDAIVTDNPARLRDLGYFIDGEKNCAEPIPTGQMHFGWKRDVAPATLHTGTEKITFTSGTTGAPRGVCLSHGNQYRTARALSTILRTKHIHRHLCVLPLSVLLENVAGAWSTLLAGGELILLPTSEVGLLGSSQFDPGRLATALDRHQPESIILLPEMLRALTTWCATNNRQFASLKLVAVGGSRVAPALLQQARDCGLPVAQGYGLSECASVVCLDTPPRPEVPATGPLGTVGQSLPHWQVSVAEDSELIVSGRGFLGYLGAPAHSGPVFTGDIGTVDAQGFVTVVGRKKNLLISSYGRNISPEWVESELCLQPEIAQALVFGDAQPWCGALLVTRPGVSPQCVDAAVQRANRALPDYARVVSWLLTDAPFSGTNGQQTPNGRPRRDAILQQYSTVIAQLYQRQHEHEHEHEHEHQNIAFKPTVNRA